VVEDVRSTRTIIVFLVATGLFMAGCSTFERDWNAMSTDPAGEVGMEGRWEGTWQSDENGHNGGLRCIITADEDDTLTARYHATYGSIFTFEYEMPMVVRREGDVYHFAAEADLGWLAGGVYEYAGTVHGDAFESTYDCKRDHGTFRMERAR
jgi:hypothetical protein